MSYIVLFLTLLNPFALFIYVLPLKQNLGLGPFINIMARASLISYAIFVFFSFIGYSLFTDVLRINFESFRIFGGLVMIGFALSFILQGKESMITIRGELSRIAAQVALPFMVGAGTITISILMGEALTKTGAIFGIAVVMLINFLVVISLAVFRYRMRQRFRTVFDKNLEILLRVNGFFVGAFGVDFVVTGIQTFF